ncbi:MAG: hypothetical protein JSU66_04855, partial [Deltaproteobacteria bacterium]
ALELHFEGVLRRAVEVDPQSRAIANRIYERVDAALRDSPWTRIGGVQVVALVTGADGRHVYPGAPPPDPDPMAAIGEGALLLPASVDLSVSMPYNAVLSILILVLFAAVHVQALFVYYRRLTRREAALLQTAVAARDTAASRARQIEHELERVRQRLDVVEPAEGKHADEIRGLQRERAALQQQLAAVVEREARLREQSVQATELESEHQALEELLDEALDDLRGKDDEIRALQSRLKLAAKEASTRSREADLVGRRLRTLYRNVEVDERAIRDLVALRDESMKLKAEEGIKRLSDDISSASVRRKVGGLPSAVPIFELGFAGKGRVYYTTGSQRRFRILAIGAKNTQKTDLEYLHRVAKGNA